MLPLSTQFFADKEYLTASETALYLGISKHSLYKLTSRRVFPLYKPSNKIIYIRRQDVDDWISESLQSSMMQMSKKANTYLLKR
ncbi:MAG: helix-turn-helix domain-containing protein [Bacteroidota bacterium]